MNFIFPFLLIFTTTVLPAAAQEAARFPVGRPFKVISISGFDVQKAGMTFTVAGAPQSNQLVGSGSAGCNTWRATVMLRDDSIEFTDISTTAKSCPKPRMTSENAFLTTLKSAQRWRMDDKGRLIVEGEAARLLLTGTGSSGASGQNSTKKR
jgi:heat shock protein HslJ